MNAHAITPMQQELLKMFSFDHSDEYAKEIKEVLTRHFLSNVENETDRLWDNGILNQEKLDSIRTEDLHNYMKRHGSACN